MSNEDLTRYQPAASVPTTVNRKTLKGLRSVDAAADIEMYRLQRQGDVGMQQVRSLMRVGTRAQEAGTMLALTQRLAVEMEPGAVHCVSAITQSVTIGLLQIINDTTDKITR